MTGATAITRIPPVVPLPWVWSDGGRKAAGFKGTTGDCVVRAIAIATGRDYREVYDDLHERSKAYMLGRRDRWAKSIAKTRASPRTGVAPPVYKALLKEAGWPWTSTMQVGSGTTVHLRASELPTGRLVVLCSRHLVAVVDHVVYDLADPTRDGTRAVYGYWRAPS